MSGPEALLAAEAPVSFVTGRQQQQQGKRDKAGTGPHTSARQPPTSGRRRDSAMMLRATSSPSMASKEACRKRSDDQGRLHRDWTPCEAKEQQVPRRKGL